MKKNLICALIGISFTANLYAQNFPEMVRVEGGTFLMGNKNNNGQADEIPAHSVRLSTYYIGKTEITVLQWKTFCEATGRKLPQAPVYGWEDDAPIVNINWFDATAYVNWLSTKTGNKYRIPTEAEWEFAARGGNSSKGFVYSGANDPNLVAWFSENSNNRSHPVGKKQPNELGLYDMTGNVWEWTNDVYAAYDSTSVVNPKGASSGDILVFKGGGLMEPAMYIRITMRGQSTNRNYIFRDLGLRVVCDDMGK